MPRVTRSGLLTTKELYVASFYRDLFIEMLISTFLLMFITFSLTTLNSDIYKPNTTHIGLMVSFVIFLIIEGYGHFSGAHMNPVVSFAFCIDGRISIIRAVCYTIAQCIGGTCGSSIVYGLCPLEVRENFKPFAPAPSIGVEQALVAEIIFTFCLVYTAISASDNTTHNTMLPSLPTAFCVGTAIMAIGTWTGACLNPIVALGPAVISKNFKHHWVYWVANYVGALSAALMYKIYKMANSAPPEGNTDNLDRKPEEQSLKGRETFKDEISDLVNKIVFLTSQHNANVYMDSKNSLNEVAPTSAV